ncbi:MAG: hypothetical protein ACI4RA_07905 [Kiritimatiellia bacterium]
MKYSAPFLLAAAVMLSGCETVQSTMNTIRDSQRPKDGVEVLQYRQCFEAGRRSESKGDVRIAGDTYGWLVERGSRYGEYGLAMLMLRKEPGSKEAAKLLVSCAKRSSCASNLFPDSAMDSAFSVAAMDKLADIAVSEHDRQDVADWLRATMFGVVTPQVTAWAAEMKKSKETTEIYKDVVSAVESSRPSQEYGKKFQWTELGDIFQGKGNTVANPGGGIELPRPPTSYSVVKFVKAPDAECRYDFDVRLDGNGTFEATEKVRSAIRRQLLKEFRGANPQDGAEDVRISFLTWKQHESAIEGSAAAVKVSAVKMEYDALTRRGKIAVRLDGRDVAAARQWAVENIAELAGGKNVVLVAGKSPPPGATFRIGSERMTEEGLLEIDFQTE